MESVIKSDVLNEKIFLKTLKNGLRVYLMPKEGFSKKYAIYATDYGSNDNEIIFHGSKKRTKLPDGIAHFLEHKMFEEKDGNVFEKFTKLGAQVNAYTNFTTTAYLFSCINEFHSNLDILLDFVHHPYFTDENVEKEKGIIGQEIRMYEDNAEWRVFFNLLRALYSVHPVQKDIAGTIDSISKINKDLLFQCYHTFYHPGNMILFAIGDIDVDKTMEQITAFFSQHRFEKYKPVETVQVKESDEIQQDYIEEKLHIASPLFAIGIKDKDNDIKGKDLLKKIITTDICLELFIGKSTELYNSLYDMGLINTSFSKSYTGEMGYGYTILSGESPEPKKVLKAILKQLDNRSINRFNERDFERIRKKRIGTFLRDFNSLEFIAHEFMDGIFKDILVFDKIEILEEISFSDIRERFETHFLPERIALSVILPK